MIIVKEVALAMTVCLLSTAAAYANQQESSVAPSSETSAMTEIVCVRMAPPTGSRIGARRVCKTKHEWDLIEQANREEIERAWRSGRPCTNSSGSGVGCGI